MVIGEERTNQHHPDEQVISGTEPTVLHVGIGLLGTKKTLDEARIYWLVGIVDAFCRDHDRRARGCDFPQ